MEVAAHAAHAHTHESAGMAPMEGHRHGSWSGHVLPGVLFLVLGLWWLLASAASFHQKRRAPFRPQPWWPLAAASETQYPRLVMLEPLLLTALPLVGVVVELYWHPGDLWYRQATTPDGERFEPDNLNNWQHAAMYSAFAFSGACALVLTQPLARIAGFATLAQAFAIELLLFWFHLRMQSGLMADVHVCLIFAVAGCAVSVVAEAALCETGAVAPTLARSFFTILQGTWFCQAAHVLYGAKPWHADDMGNSMMLPVVFTAHVLGVAAAVLAIFVAVGRASAHVQLMSSRGDALPKLLGLVPVRGNPQRSCEADSGDADNKLGV